MCIYVSTHLAVNNISCSDKSQEQNKTCLIHSWGGGEGCMRGMDYGRYMAKPVLDGGHFVYAN